MRPKIDDFTLSDKYKVKFDTDTEYELELIEITPFKKSEQSGQVPFSLFFRGGVRQPIYIQGTYEIVDESNVSKNLFLIPRQPDEKGVYYEAIIQ